MTTRDSRTTSHPGTALAVVAALAMGATVQAAEAQANDRSAQQQRTPQSESRSAIDREQVKQDLGTTSASAIVLGKVIELRDINIDAPVREQHRLIKVESRDGGTIVVDAGRADAAGGLDLERGDHVIAVGKQARINDRPVLFAKVIGEMTSVGAHQRRGATAQQMPGEQAASGNLDGIATGESTIGDVQGRYGKQGATTQEDKDVVVQLFESDNPATDQYGVFDADFAWESSDEWYSDWSDAESAWTNDPEVAYYDMWGADELDDWTVWDW
ncbi:MAG TPA: hypothetical protein VLT59_07800 [Steroidobacteraceae bacterium]|nr:hypothetical protein [Steroidobacteraceae bacterium]